MSEKNRIQITKHYGNGCLKNLIINLFDSDGLVSTFYLEYPKEILSFCIDGAKTDIFEGKSEISVFKEEKLKTSKNK